MWRKLFLAGGAASAAFALMAAPVRAADHLDGPAALANPDGDLDDLFAWMTPDGNKVNLVMTFYPNAPGGTELSDQVLYVFHVSSMASYGAADSDSIDIVCGFDAAQTLSCWAGDRDYVSGDASSPGGITSASGKMKVFAGLRADPFFFNLDGFKTVAHAVAQAAGSLTFDDDGCPALDQGTADALVAQLAETSGGDPAVNNLAGFSAQTLVVQIDKDLVASGGPILAVWASTHARQ